MKITERLKPSLGLLTDLYQLTMAAGYLGTHTGRGDERSPRPTLGQRRGCFHLFFRKSPFGGSYAVAAGLEDAIDYLRGLAFDAEDLAYLEALITRDGRPLFNPSFLEYLRGFRFTCDVDAVPEGTTVFAQEPLLRVTGPLPEAQLVETALLTILNFQTLVATKAARIVHAAAGDAVIEFGLRRAQGIDGGLSASRAAYLGGVHATSNVLAGRLYGIPVRGTHAHSWVQSFPDEETAFAAFAEAMPANCTLLVDTYDTLEGVKHAIVVGQKLRASGHHLLGVRLDSGDLLELSRASRVLLDQAGLHGTKIVASGDLDEYEITSLEAAGAPIDIWGVGTRLVTAYDQPALGAVYKLMAVEDEDGAWQPRIKRSDSRAKTTIPGFLQIRRFEQDERILGDVIYDPRDGFETPTRARAYAEPHGPREFSPGTASRDLLEPVLRGGALVKPLPTLDEARARAAQELARLPDAARAIDRPAPCWVGLEERLYARREAMIAAIERGVALAERDPLKRGLP